MTKNLSSKKVNISVVIPTLNNRSQFLKEALNSIKDQIYEPLEIIIVNNGNNDLKLTNLSLTVKQFKIKYKSGVSEARNFGASHASGEFIAFLDDDDLWPPEYLDVIKNHIEQNNPDCLVASLSKLKEGKIFNYKNIEGQIKEDIILSRNPGITGSSVVVKKTTFLKIGGYDNELITGEDKSLILELINKNFKIVTVSEIKAIHREHHSDIRLSNDQNMSKGINQFYKKYRKQMNTFQKLDNLYKIKKYKWLVNKTFVNSFIYLCLLFLIFLKKYLFKFIK